MKEYEDKFGLLHPTRFGSENGVLYRAYHRRLRKLKALHTGAEAPDADWAEVHSISSTIVNLHDNRFQANPPENGDHFSHDNMKGLYSLCKDLAPQAFRKLPLVRWNSRNWLHPNGWLVHLCYKYPKLLKVPGVLAILLIMMNYSLKRPDEQTSGKLLWWLVFHDLGIESKLPIHNWEKDFHYYFSNAGRYANEDHPIRVLAHTIYSPVGNFV